MFIDVLLAVDVSVVPGDGIAVVKHASRRE
jgi:hypothetical protein